MKQVIQTLSSGNIEVRDVPIPTLADKFALVRTTASVISAGTEKTKIDMGKKNLLQKAKARPDLVKQVINKMRAEGLAKTLQTVKTRLDSPSPLGYSCAGEVYALGGLVDGLQVGDRVACAGAGYANHAEFVAIPKNLIARIPAGVTDEEAAFATLGSIALQGVRLADPKMGETFLVLGLGLLGQIAVQLLRANGCNVLGTDLSPELIKQAEKFSAIGVAGDIAAACKELTGGYGVDGVLVCAGTESNQPIEVCGAATREKGRVVVVGAVRMDIPREEYFKKEISVVISRSYGPGRYDPDYEESGIDYPYGYVRFTEQRNMQTILGLMATGQLDVKSLVTHRFELDQAATAYDLIEGKRKEPYLGIVLNYRKPGAGDASAAKIVTNSAPLDKSAIGLSFFGAGNYATASLLPYMQSHAGIDLRGLVTASGSSAQGVADKFGFRFCAGELSGLFDNDTDAVVVTTRHDSHASSVIAALQAGKHVYVEKPLALTIEEISDIYQLVSEKHDAQLMVGFNRRFAPLVKTAVEHFADIVGPRVISIRVNAGNIPADHWINDPVIGGGRFIGEGCHFVDLASALCGANPTTVYAVASAKAEKSPLLNDNLSVVLTFGNGSIANILYTADGSKSLPKERVEIFAGGSSAVIDDFKSLTLYHQNSKVTTRKLPAQDKGQKAMIDAWLSGLQSGKACVSYESLISNSVATIMAMESLTIGAPVQVDLGILVSESDLDGAAISDESRDLQNG